MNLYIFGPFLILPSSQESIVTQKNHCFFLNGWIRLVELWNNNPSNMALFGTWKMLGSWTYRNRKSHRIPSMRQSGASNRLNAAFRCCWVFYWCRGWRSCMMWMWNFHQATWFFGVRVAAWRSCSSWILWASFDRPSWTIIDVNNDFNMSCDAYLSNMQHV